MLNHGSQQFHCDDCPGYFIDQRGLRNRVIYGCPHARHYQCPYCSFKSKGTSNVYRHIRSIHIGQKVYLNDLKNHRTLFARKGRPIV